MDYDQHECLYGDDDYDYNYSEGEESYRPPARRKKLPRCKYCGSYAVRWKKPMWDKWKLYDIHTDSLHVCKHKPKPLTPDDYLEARVAERERDDELEEERKIIQIATSGYSFPATCSSSGRSDSLVALCNDGTLWKLFLSGKRANEWTQLPSIPQGDEQ